MGRAAERVHGGCSGMRLRIGGGCVLAGPDHKGPRLAMARWQRRSGGAASPSSTPRPAAPLPGISSGRSRSLNLPDRHAGGVLRMHARGQRRVVVPLPKDDPQTGFSSTCFFLPSDSFRTPSDVTSASESVAFSSVTALSLTLRPPPLIWRRASLVEATRPAATN
jgi:hypothetical protein